MQPNENIATWVSVSVCVCSVGLCECKWRQKVDIVLLIEYCIILYLIVFRQCRV